MTTEIVETPFSKMGSMSTYMTQKIVEFVRAHPDCTVTDIERGVPLRDAGTAWSILCHVDTPGFPIISTSGGNAERGQTWRFRVGE